MENVKEEIVRLSAKTQNVSVQIFKALKASCGMDDLLRLRILTECVKLYEYASELTDGAEQEVSFERIAMLTSVRSYCMGVNSIMLMCFQLGSINSDLCIDFGYQLEQIKDEAKTMIEQGTKELQDKFKDLDSDISLEF